MRIPIFISLLIHGAFFSAVLLIFPLRPYSWLNRPVVYRVELVSVPAKIENVTTREENQVPIKSEQDLSIIAPIPEKVTRIPEEKKSEPLNNSAEYVDKGEDASTNQLTVNAKDFPFAYYLAILRNRVQNNWQPPYQTRETQDKFTAVVRFQVLREGDIANIELEKSSGRFLFDQAAQRAVHVVGRMPPLPDQFRGDFLSVHIEFEAVW